MTPRFAAVLLAVLAGSWNSSSFAAAETAAAETRFVQVEARTRDQRDALANTGMSIEFVRSDSVWGFANENALKALREGGYRVLGDYPRETGRGGHQGGSQGESRGESNGALDFPTADSRYHNYAEMTAALKSLQSRHADLVRVQSIGKTVEGRDIWAVHINTDPESLASGTSAKPGAIFMGNHHAREHLSAEIPFMLAEHLLANRDAPEIASLLASRDLWIIPMVNPDGVEYDVASGRYKYWRKNRKANKAGTYGVDLNRNYGFKWGTGGSSNDSGSDVYMGEAPFSEPESQAIRDFVSSHLNARVLLTFHTFSELILYPWGNTHDAIGNARDLAVFRKMAETMAQWNRYTPEQSSDLYIASGDTTDWAYGEHGIFAFTFELSPSSGGFNGFYPGAGVIDQVFQDNLRPCLYLIDKAGDPYQVLESEPTGFLMNYVAPRP